jgi:hypothetical protein
MVSWVEVEDILRMVVISSEELPLYYHLPKIT